MGGHLVQPRLERERVEQVRHVVQDGDARVSRCRIDQLEHVGKEGRETPPVMVHGAGPIEHGRDERRAPRWTAGTDWLVRRPPGPAELVERGTGRRADGGQWRGEVGAATQVDRDDRLPQPHRGVHELETAGRGAGPGGAGDQGAAGQLRPAGGGRAAGKLIKTEAGAGPRDDTPGAHRTDDHGPPDGHDEARTGRPYLPLIGVQPVEPGGERSFRCAGDQRDGKLAGQPLPHGRIGRAEVQQPSGLTRYAPQVGDHQGGSRGKPRGGRGRPDGERPYQPGRGRGGQPGRAPPADLGHAEEDERQDQRELGEDHMQDDQSHPDHSQELATARCVSGYHVTCAPWRALRY